MLLGLGSDQDISLYKVSHLYPEKPVFTGHPLGSTTFHSYNKTRVTQLVQFIQLVTSEGRTEPSCLTQEPVLSPGTRTW